MDPSSFMPAWRRWNQDEIKKIIIDSTSPVSHPQAPGSGRVGESVVDIFRPPSRATCVWRQRGTLKNRQLFHQNRFMGVGYAPIMESVTSLEWNNMNRWRFPCMRSPQNLVVTKILHVQILGLQLSMIFASTTSPTKNINIPSFPTRERKSVTLEHL